MKLIDTLAQEITGSGVKVCISDTGIDIGHEDLASNVTGTIHNFTSGTFHDSEGHGTSVAGIIGAVGWNGKGSRGIAPNVSLGGNNFLESNQSMSSVITQASGNYDVYNYSYGDNYFSDWPSDATYVAHLKNYYNTKRSGLGVFYVKAAGNEYQNYDSGLQAYVPHNANVPLENETPYVLVVGAYNAKGKKSSYSNAGSNLWISAPGGEYGDTDPAIVTTDISGCSQGYSVTTSYPINPFESGHALNSNCNYISTFNGTSAATPMVVGAISLILEANENLTNRDVKYILAKSARKIDPSSVNISHQEPSLNLSGHTYDYGWVTNAAGFPFHNWYGFGAIDVDKAIELASSYSGGLPDLTSTSVSSASNLNLSIPDSSATGVTSTLNVTSGLTVESIQITVNIDHTSSGDLGIEIISPSGTKSHLININNSLLIDFDEDLEDFVMLSNAFYGESATGTWTIKVVDGLGYYTGTLKNWKITINGSNSVIQK